MDCPACKDAMVVLELEQVEVDYCFDCGGIWLDAGELELLLEDGENSGELLKSFRQVKNSAEQPRKCPICLKKMIKTAAGNDVLIDKCKKDHGIWFDNGELQQVLTAGKLDQENRIQKLLAEMFSKNVNIKD